LLEDTIDAPSQETCVIVARNYNTHLRHNAAQHCPWLKVIMFRRIT
jgi:hypothetical protein